MNRREFIALAGVVTPGWRPGLVKPPLTSPRPTPQQLAWQRAELALFVHFTVNTFTDREWGDGTESPSEPVLQVSTYWSTSPPALLEAYARPGFAANTQLSCVVVLDVCPAHVAPDRKSVV